MQRPTTPVRILFERCAAGDESAWHEFLKRFGPTIRRAVRLVLGPRACPGEVEDFAQDVYCGLLVHDGHRLRAFQGSTECQASGFLLRTAERLARDRARLERRRHGRGPWLRQLAASETVPDPGPGPEAITLGGEQRRLFVAGCRAVLRESLAARAVELVLFEGWASRELARASRGRFTPGAIDTLLSRARQRLAPRGMLVPRRPGLRALDLRSDA